MVEKIDPWSHPENLSLEIIGNMRPIDCKAILGSNALLYLGESHVDEYSAVRQHLSKRAQEIAAAGITHWAIEASRLGRMALKKLRRNPSIDLSEIDLGPRLDSSDYERIIRAFSQIGVDIIPIDTESMQIYSHQQRENVLEKELTDIYEADAFAKVAVLIGMAHTFRGRLMKDFYFLGGRTEKRGIPSVVVAYIVNGNFYSETLSKAIRLAKVKQEKFMIDMRPYQHTLNVPWDMGHVDFVINLPKL